MKKFEQELKQKAHLNKIKNAKKTVPMPGKSTKMSTIKNDETQVLISLYQKKRFDSIPAYKLLRTAGLQQYTRGFIERGYGVKLGVLFALSEKDKNRLYEDIKVLPGHAVKLDKLIETISRHSYLEPDDEMGSNSSNFDKQSADGALYSGSNSNIGDEPKQRAVGSHRPSKPQDKLSLDVGKLKFNDPEYEKQLQRVINEYTPNAQTHTNEKPKDKKPNVFRQDSGNSSSRSGKNNEKITINFNKLKMLEEKEFESEKNMEKVANEYTPLGDDKDKKKRTFNEKILEKRTPNVGSNEPVRKYSKTKYIPNTKAQPPPSDFKKKPSIINSALENKPTTKKVDSQKSRPSPATAIQTSTASKLKNINLGIQTAETESSTAKIMEITFELEKVKALNRSFDGSLMSSTIANIDIEELVFAFSGYVYANVVAAPQPVWPVENTATGSAHDFNILENQKCDMEESIEDEVGNILRESYLHPLYREDEPIDENIESGQANQNQEDNQANSETEYLANSEGEQQEEERPHNQFLQANQQNTLKQSSVSSFMGGESYHFGLNQPLQIFNESQPTELDYYKPTVDSIANFIKNIVLTAKMEREIPIMAAHYLQVFIHKTGILFTSLNYKRILVTLLLLASKIWDDESFQSPSFSKTFPEYTTILLNQMEKQVLKALDYKLKLDKKQYASIYFQLRKYARKNLRSCQNKKLNLHRIRELQQGVKKDYKASYLDKRNSF